MKRHGMKISLAVKMILGVFMLTVILSAISLMVGSALHRLIVLTKYENETSHMSSTVRTLLEHVSGEMFFEREAETYRNVPADLKQRLFDEHIKVVEALRSEDDQLRKEADENYEKVFKEYAQYFKKIHDDEYNDVRSLLFRMAEVNDVYRIMVVTVEEEQGRILKIFDTFDQTRDHMSGAFDYVDNFDDFRRFVESGSEDDYFISFGDPADRGTFYACVTPYLSEETGEIIGYVEVFELWNDAFEDQHSFIFNYLVVVGIAAVVLSGAAFYTTTRFVASPIREMSKAAQKLSSEEGKQDKHYFAKLNIKTGDEIESLSDAMKKMESELNEYISELTVMTAEKERIRTEIRVAARIQKDMLPGSYPEPVRNICRAAAAGALWKSRSRPRRPPERCPENHERQTALRSGQKRHLPLSSFCCRFPHAASAWRDRPAGVCRLWLLSVPLPITVPFSVLCLFSFRGIFLSQTLRISAPFTISSQSSSYSMPTAAASWGTRLVGVMPGRVLTSRK